MPKHADEAGPTKPHRSNWQNRFQVKVYLSFINFCITNDIFTLVDERFNTVVHFLYIRNGEIIGNDSKMLKTNTKEQFYGTLVILFILGSEAVLPFSSLWKLMNTISFVSLSTLYLTSWPIKKGSLVWSLSYLKRPYSVFNVVSQQSFKRISTFL